MTTANATLPADKFDTATVFVRPTELPTRASLDNLAVLPGFNTRVKDADYAERVAGVAESIAAHGFFDDKPFAVVMLENDPTIYIYDGEHRFDAAKQALLDGAEFPDGLPIAWAKDGATVKDLTIHLAHGNNGERLNMVELASVVRRMQGLDMDKGEIAAALGRTTRHVDNLFVLAAAPAAVKKAVANNQIAGAEAVKLLRKDSTTAAAKVAEAVQAAEDKGKAKATPKTMRETNPTPMKTIKVDLSMPEGDAMGDVLKAMAKNIREQVKVDGDDKLTETGRIAISITVIDHEKIAANAAAAQAKAAAAAKRATEKAEADAKRTADKAAADKAKAAAAAAKTKADAAAKKTADKPKGKTPEKTKTAPAAKKPATPKKAAQGTKTPAKTESKRSAPESAPSDENNGL